MGYVRKKHPGYPTLNVYVPKWTAPAEEIVQPYGLSASKMKVILHNFYLGMISSRVKYKNDDAPSWFEHGYFPVHWALLKQVASNNYPAYVKALEESKIIERRRNTSGGKNYLPGQYSQLYRFISQHGDIRFRVDQITDYRDIRAVLRTRDRYALRDDYDTHNLPLNPIQAVLKNFVSQCFIDTGVADSISKRGSEDVSKSHYYDLEMETFEAINNNTVGWFTVDDFGERCHTHFTNLKSLYRPALRFRGHEKLPLTQIDIKNSQPYFSAIIANGPDLIDDLLPEFEILKPLISNITGRPDTVSYLELCRAGQLYEYLGNQIGKARNEVKATIFRAVIFSKMNVYGNDRILRDAFKKAFPSVYDLFTKIKKLAEDDLPELSHILNERQAKFSGTKNSYKILSCAMQRLESRIITQYISRRLIDKSLGPFLTIHDSFLVLPQHKDAAIDCIITVLREHSIDPPTLTIEALDYPSSGNNNHYQ